METIGQRIRRERAARGMTQKQLAARLRVGASHVSKIETGRESPSNALIEKAAAAFLADPDELMLVARRMPEHIMGRLAIDPAHSARELRRWQNARR